MEEAKNNLFQNMVIKSEYDQEIPLTNCRPTNGTARESYRTFTVKIHPKDNKSKATSSFFLVKMIVKLERTQSNAYQSKDQHRSPT